MGEPTAQGEIKLADTLIEFTENMIFLGEISRREIGVDGAQVGWIDGAGENIRPVGHIGNAEIAERAALRKRLQCEQLAR